MYLKGAQIDPKNILTEWNGREGKFVRTFGINDTRNNNEWRSTWQGILDNIKKSLGRPGIEFEKCTEAGCGLEHVEAESLEENYQKQKPFEVTNIIDYVIDDDTHSVDLIHEVHDDEFWEKLKDGSIKYVSPMIWPNNGGAESKGTGRADLPVIDAWDYEWVHTAFLEKDPAFGEIANVKTTCEGKNCGIQLLSAQLIAQDDKPMCGNCEFFVEDHTCKLVKGEILYKDLCDLHVFGKTQTPGTKINPKYDKPEVNYRSPLTATLADPSTTTLTPLKEVPLLFRHKKKLHLVSASSCVQEIIKKKKDSGIKIDDQALAIAYSECGESSSLKSSLKQCTCSENKIMADSEQQLVELKSKLKATEHDKKELEAKVHAQEEKDEKAHEGKRARYAKLFATTNNEEDEKKMMAILKATEDEEDMKTAKEEYENHKSARKAQEEDPEKKELMKSNKAMQAKIAEPMIAGLVAIRKGKLSESELTNYEVALKAQNFTEIQSAYDNEKYLITQADSLSATTYSGLAFPGEESSHALSAKSIDDILEAGN